MILPAAVDRTHPKTPKQTQPLEQNVEETFVVMPWVKLTKPISGRTKSGNTLLTFQLETVITPAQFFFVQDENVSKQSETSTVLLHK